MRIACLSDLHLGYRGAGRTEGGRSIRERDVENVFAQAVDAICDRGVDLVTIAGDVFDTVVPSTAAKDAFLEGVGRLAQHSPVVIIGGNHETPRTHGVLSPNVLGRWVGDVHVLGPGQYFTANIAETYGAEPYAVQGFGYSCLGREGVVAPQPIETGTNILLLHAAVRSSARPGALGSFYSGPGAYDVARPEGFDIVICGDYHEHEILSLAPEWKVGGYSSEAFDQCRPGAPLAFYSGSLERVSSNIWHETAPKGWVLVDTDARTLELVEVVTRRVMDVVWRDGPTPTADAVNMKFAELTMDPLTLGALVRLKVEGMPPAERAGIDHGLVAELRQRCVLFTLAIEVAAESGADLGDRRARRGQSLETMLEEFAEGEEDAVLARMRAHLGLGTHMLEEG